MNDADLEAVRRASERLLLERLVTEDVVPGLPGQPPFSLTLGRDEYTASFEQCGGWDGWTQHVALSVDYATQQPRYTGFVLVGNEHGAASGKIAYLALQAGKPVVIIKGNEGWYGERDYHPASLAVARRAWVARHGPKHFRDAWQVE